LYIYDAKVWIHPLPTEANRTISYTGKVTVQDDRVLRIDIIFYRKASQDSTTKGSLEMLISPSVNSRPLFLQSPPALERLCHASVVCLPKIHNTTRRPRATTPQRRDAQLIPFPRI
jgi:hypothetical protein